MENPYSAPQSPKYERLPPRLRARDMGSILFFSVCAGVLVGVVTNAMNGFIAIEYFRVRSHLFAFSNPWLKAISQGAAEGFRYGFFNGGIYLALITFFSQRRCTLRQAKVFIVWAIGIAIFVWLVFGSISMLGVDYRPRYVGDFSNFRLDGPTGKFAWVNNCIDGLTYFSPVITFVAAIGCVIKYRLEWKSSDDSDQIDRSNAPIQR